MKKLMFSGLVFSSGVLLSDVIIFGLMHYEQNFTWWQASFKVVLLLMLFAWVNRNVNTEKYQSEDISKLQDEIASLREQLKSKEKDEEKLNFFKKEYN